jgi:hypothetical protein
MGMGSISQVHKRLQSRKLNRYEIHEVSIYEHDSDNKGPSTVVRYKHSDKISDLVKRYMKNKNVKHSVDLYVQDTWNAEKKFYSEHYFKSDDSCSKFAPFKKKWQKYFFLGAKRTCKDIVIYKN